MVDELELEEMPVPEREPDGDAPAILVAEEDDATAELEAADALVEADEDN